MQPVEQAEIVRRLRTARGHLEAVTSMVERGESCENVLHQLGAVQSALRAAGTRLLLCQVKHSRDVILNGACPEDQAAELTRISNLYSLMIQYSDLGGITTGERKTE